MKRLLLFLTLFCAATVGMCAMKKTATFTGIDTYDDGNIKVEWATNDATTPTAFFTTEPKGVRCYALRSGGAIGSTMTVTILNPSITDISMYAGARDHTKTTTVLPAQGGKVVRDNNGVNNVTEVPGNTIVFENQSTGTYAVEYLTYNVYDPFEPDVVEKSYSITMKTATTTTNPNNNAASVTLANAIATGAEYLSGSITGTNIGYAYINGMKIGSSSNTGNATFTMSQLGQVEITKLVVHTKSFDSTSKYTLTVNGTQVATNLTPGTDYTYVPTAATTLKTIKLATSAKRIYISGFDVYYNVLVPKPVATPTADPESGAELTVGDKVTFACATPGAKATYTVDGGEATTADFPFEYGFGETGEHTVVVTASRENMTSASATFTYNVVPSQGLATITAQREPGQYSHLTSQKFIVSDAQSIVWNIKGLTSGKDIENTNTAGLDADNVFTFELNEDTQVEIIATDANGKDAKFTGTYLVKRPNLIYSVAPGSKVAPFTVVTVQSDEIPFTCDWNVKQTYFDEDNKEQSGVQELRSSNKIFSTYNGCTAVITCTIPNGLDGYSVTETVEYIVTVPMPPVPSIPTGSEVMEGTVVTLELDPFTIPEWTYVYNINMDGTLNPNHFVYSKEGIVVDKSHFAFLAMSWNQKGWGQYTMFTYKVVDEPGKEDGEKWVIVTDASQILTDGSEYVLGFTGAPKANSDVENWLMGAAYSTNKYHTVIKNAPIVNQEIYNLPEGTTIVTFEATGNATFPFIMKNKETGKYLYNNASGTGNQLGAEDDKAETGYFKITIGEGNNAIIDFKKYNGTVNYQLMVNTDSGSERFASYTGSQKYPQIYRKVKNILPGTPAKLGVKVHHTEYELDGTLKTRTPFVTGAEHNDHVDLTFAGMSENGAQLYQGKVNNLCGYVIIEIEGQEFVGHKNYAKTNFHGAQKAISIDGDDISGCDEEHAPYVYLSNTQNSPLTATGSENAVPMSTNPNEYHDVLVHHKASVVTVAVKPAASVNIRLDSADEDMTGINDIVANDANDAEAWYNLQGVRVANPERGNIYIHITGNKAVKELVK